MGIKAPAPAQANRSVMEWEVSVSTLLMHQGKLYSPWLELSAPGSSGEMLVHLRYHAFVAYGRKLYWYMELPVGMSARYVQWTGPKSPRETRTKTDLWGE